MCISQVRKFLLRELDRLLAEVERIKCRLGKGLRHIRSVPAFTATDVQHRAAALQSFYETVDGCKWTNMPVRYVIHLTNSGAICLWYVLCTIQKPAWWIVHFIGIQKWSWTYNLLLTKVATHMTISVVGKITFRKAARIPSYLAASHWVVCARHERLRWASTWTSERHRSRCIRSHAVHWAAEIE